MKIKVLFLSLIIFSLFVGCSKNSGNQSVLQMLAANQKNQYGEIINGLEKISKNPFPEAIPKIIPLLASENVRIREAAIRALKVYGAEIIPDLVDNISSNNDNVKNACLTLLEDIGKPALPTMKTLLNNKDDIIKMAAIQVLGDIGDSSVIVDLSNLLDSKNPSIVISAVVALGKLKAKPAIGKITQLLSSDDPNVKTAAVQALRNIGDPSVVPLIIANIKETDDTEYLLNALQTIEILSKGHYKMSWATGILTSIFNYDKIDSRVMADAAYMMYKAGKVDGIMNIEQNIKRGVYYNYPLIMAYFVDVLSKLGKQSHVVDTFKTVLKHYQNDFVSAKIYVSMYNFGYRAYKTKILAIANSDDEQAVKIALDACVKNNFTEICKELPALVKKPSFAIIQNAIETGGHFQCDSLIPYFESVFGKSDYSYEIKDIILENISKYKKASAMKVLKLASQDSDVYVQYAAKKILEGMQ